MSVNNSIAANLKDFREKKDLTQEKLAELAGCSKNHLSALERGVKFPSSSLIDKFSTILRIKPYELFLDKTDKKKLQRKDNFVDYVMDSIDKDQLLKIVKKQEDYT